MTDNAIEVAHNPAAPEDERQDALRQAQKASMPSTVDNMLPLVQYVQQQYEELQMTKALARAKAAPYPSSAVSEGRPGMQSVWLDDQRISVMGDWYERPTSFSFEMMRQMVNQTPILGGVILTRQRQVKRFCRAQLDGNGPGFQIALKDPTMKQGDQERQSIQMLESFFTNCGWESNPRQRMRLKRDNFSGFMAKVVRDSLIMDSAPIETEWKRDKSLGLDGFYAVDGATIRLCCEHGYDGDDEIFALQVVEGVVRTAYTYDDLIYVPRNPRSDVLAGGYGMSETELLIRVVTGFLNAMTYNLKYFDSNAIPKGILHLSGEYGQDDLNAFKRYWNNMVRGINNAWTLPVLVSRNQESKASFENFGVDTTDAMFTKWMTFLASIICAIYGMAPDEINFESFTNGPSSLSGSDTEEKLINSKDKGLRPLLSHFEDLFSDFIVSEWGGKYCFNWTGLDEEDPKDVWDQQKTLLTVNEARKVRGWDEIKEDWGGAPLNPALMGAYQAAQQAAGEDYGQPDDQQDDGGAGTPPPSGQPGDAGDDPAGDATVDPDEEQDNGPEMQKSFGLGTPIWRLDP